MSTTKTKGTALITGASAGTGAIYADRLAKRGYDQILVARNRSRLAALAQRLENETGRSGKTIGANLNDKADLQCRRAHPADLRCGSRLRRARRRHYHQHRFDRGDLAGNAKRGLWRQQSVRAGLQPVAPS